MKEINTELTKERIEMLLNIDESIKNLSEEIFNYVNKHSEFYEDTKSKHNEILSNLLSKIGNARIDGQELIRIEYNELRNKKSS